MFPLTYVDLEYETSISSWDIWNADSILMIDLLFIQLVTRLNSPNAYEADIHNEIW